MSSRAALHSSESSEWYTPEWVIERARRLMGNITLDPASSAEANKTIRAQTFFSFGGLEQSWFGNVWLNPPYGGHTAKWVAKLMEEYWDKQAMQQACLLVSAVPDRNWFRPLWEFPMVFFYDRIKFVGPATRLSQKSPTNGNVLVWLPPESMWPSDAKITLSTVFEDVGQVVMA